jgi:hypothetical protein
MLIIFSISLDKIEILFTYHLMWLAIQYVKCDAKISVHNSRFCVDVLVNVKCSDPKIKIQPMFLI